MMPDEVEQRARELRREADAAVADREYARQHPQAWWIDR